MKNSNTYTVELSFFCDEANGEYGLAHSNSIDKGFNAFWSGIGIFHDVFEHYFEGIHPFFSGDYEFNIGGEVAAMGHLAYYYSMLRVENRFTRGGYYAPETSIARTTYSDMEEAISYGNMNFGDKLLSNVPKQKNANSYFLDGVINEHLYHIEETKVGENCEKEYRAAARAYKKSITENKITNLYTWGFKQAQNIAPNTEENQNTLSEFIAFWDAFCKRNSAEDFVNLVDKVIFTITTGEELSWKAIFVTHEGEEIDIKNISYIEDLYMSEVEEF